VVTALAVILRSRAAPVTALADRPIDAAHDRTARAPVPGVLNDANPLGLGEDHAEQRQCVEMRGPVGMVLDGEQVLAEPVGQARRLEQALRVAGVRSQE
jgi:hypothetical protein